jgi:DNA-binding CsgD family transcriptional regulator
MAAATGSAAELFERESELEQIDDALHRGSAGLGGLLIIEGAAGVGKTRLLAELAARARRSEMRVLTARGGELERDFAYGVVRQLFEPVLAASSDGGRRSLLSGAAALAAPALGLSGGAPEGESTDPTFAVAHGLYWLAANLASSARLAICVDDVHWSDEPSLAWLVHLARRLEGMPLVVACASRPPEDRSHGLSALLAESSLGTLMLRPLSESATFALLNVRLAGGVDPRFGSACHAATGGNPFLLQQLLDWLATEGLPPTADSAPRVQELGGQAISHSIRARLGRLSASAVGLAQAVAVLGIETELRDAAALAALDLDEASRCADTLAAAGFLRPERPLAFAHPIIREAVYGALPAGERARRHAAAAGLLLERGAKVDDIARHALHADPAGDDRLVDALSGAAGEASRRGAPEAAVMYLKRALAEAPPEALRAKVHYELGAAQLRSGAVELGRGAAEEPEAFEHLRAAFQSSVDPAARAAAARTLGDALLGSERHREAVELLDRAVADLGDAEPELALQLEAHLTLAAYLDSGADSPIAARLASRQTPTGTTPGERLLLGVLAHQRMFAGSPATEIATLAGHAIPEGSVYADQLTPQGPNFVAICLMCADEFDQAQGLLDRMLAEARTTGNIRAASMALCWRSHLAYRRGALVDAEADSREALDIASARGWEIPMGGTRGALAEALRERGNLEAAERALAGPEPVRRTFPWCYFQHSRGRLRAALGDVEGGLREVLECGRHLSAWGPAGSADVPWRSTAAELHLALGQGEDAQRLATEELKLARSFGAPRALGVALRAVAVTERTRPVRRLELVHESVRVLEDTPAHLELARALVELGADLRRSGERVAARDPLRRGLDLAHRSGARPLATRAHEELIATGARPRRLLVSGVDSLTASERRVARMAAEGLTNREIAQALFVTQRTVETHLSRAYQKLDVSSRKALPRALGGE